MHSEHDDYLCYKIRRAELLSPPLSAHSFIVLITPWSPIMCFSPFVSLIL